MSEKINKSVKIDIKEGLKKIYPEVFEDNKINFEKLKALLTGEIIENEDDRFYFNWAGKSNLYKLIQTPAYGTLKPDKEKSVDFDNTENIVIVGENLETLKLLLKPYFGKVKMIYIDPPYNTGKDFIYRDNFKEPLKDYLEKTGQIDGKGNKLTTNTEASGRYHSDWLNFMYPRLYFAKNLLRDDGVIFISIDDHEVHHLRMIMDEIFGEENFVTNFIWKKKSTSTNVEGVQVSSLTDYVLTYGKTINSKLKTRIRPKETRSYPYEDAEGRYRLTIIEKKHAGAYQRESMRFPIIGVYPREGKRWQIGIKTAKELERKNRFILDNGIVKLKIYEFEDKDTISAQPNLLDKQGSTDIAQKMLTDILGRQEIFDNPKPVELIYHLISIICDQDDCVLDFFAGSGTTGHAVWDLNKEDGGNRKFILVQLDEKVQDEEIKKDFPTVADICIERLKRVSEKYKHPVPSGHPSMRGELNTLSANADTPLKEANNSPSMKGWQAKPDGVVKWNELPFNPDLKKKARELRKAGNLSEVLFWNQVKNKQFLGLDFDRQKIIGDYIVDFYCKNLGLIIEIEGESHNYKVDYDKKREEYLNSLGLKVIHILDEDIKKNLNGVMEFLKMEIENTPSLRDTPLKEGNNLTGDFGFKVFRLAHSNFNLKDEFEIEKGEDIVELKKRYLEWLGVFVDQPLIHDWREIDVIYEIMLKEGLNLNSKIEKIKIKENNFYYVKDVGQNLDFYICLENRIENETIEEIRTSKYKGKIFVFLDNALTDSDKINLSAFVRLKVI